MKPRITVNQKVTASLTTTLGYAMEKGGFGGLFSDLPRDIQAQFNGTTTRLRRKVCVHVPGGGYYSNMDLGEDAEVTVTWTLKEEGITSD